MNSVSTRRTNSGPADAECGVLCEVIYLDTLALLVIKGLEVAKPRFPPVQSLIHPALAVL